jgi:gas vesicle protein
MNAGRMIFGIVIGAAAGALAGILFAPEKGSETRRKLFEKGDNYTRSLKNRFNTIKNNWSKSGNSEYAGENEFRQESTNTSPSF